MQSKKSSTFSITMTFLPIERTVEIGRSPSVLDVALAHKIPLNHSCGGMGSCTTCRIHVKSDLTALEPRNEVEQEMADMKGFKEEERLACQLAPADGLVVEIPPSTEALQRRR